MERAEEIFFWAKALDIFDSMGIRRCRGYAVRLESGLRITVGLPRRNSSMRSYVDLSKVRFSSLFTLDEGNFPELMPISIYRGSFSGFAVAVSQPCRPFELTQKRRQTAFAKALH